MEFVGVYVGSMNLEYNLGLAIFGENLGLVYMATTMWICGYDGLCCAADSELESFVVANNELKLFGWDPTLKRTVSYLT